MKKIILTLLVVALFAFPALPCLAGPKLDVPEPVYTFKTVPEGEQILHEFVVRNTGDTDLNITDVLPP